jgi:hypothetical protein
MSRFSQSGEEGLYTVEMKLNNAARNDWLTERAAPPPSSQLLQYLSEFKVWFTWLQVIFASMLGDTFGIKDFKELIECDFGCLLKCDH